MSRIEVERWRTLSPLISAALDLDGGAREAWLAQLEADDESLARELRSWLDRHRELDADGFLEQSGADDWLFLVQPGATIGHYRLLNCIGRGGMGTVWRAERADGLYEDEVAVKVLSTSRIHHASRFAQERQLLARLRHPNIASLLDAGITAEGTPYIVLELVEGLPIDTYCDEQRLSIADRVQLFLLVLDAVAAAHRQLIVHRDLKPSNIMVSNNGEVKLLDFGIAKILEDTARDESSPDLTVDLGQPLTPAYAAPEQRSGAPVSTATDIYALGVLLAKLLCGDLPKTEPSSNGDPDADPKRMSAVFEAQEAIAQQWSATARSMRVDQLRNELTGDLDHVVARASRQHPEQRYATVAEFRDDLGRYLRHEPVIARQGNTVYRVRKFGRRHRRTLMVALVAFVLLGATVALLVRERLQGTRQQQLAAFEAQRAEASEQFMSLVLEVVGPGGKQLTPLELLDAVIDAMDVRYAYDPRFIARMRSELSRRYMDLGANERAFEVLEQALVIARAENDGESLAAANCALVRVLPRVGLQARQQGALDEALDALGKLPNASLRIRVNCLRAEAEALQARDRPDESIRLLGEARTLLASSDVPDAGLLTGVLTQLGGIHLARGRLGDAYDANMAASRVFSETGRGDTVGAAITLQNSSTLLGLMGETLASDAIMQQALERQFKARPDVSPNALTLINDARNAMRLHRLDHAEAQLEKALGQAKNEGDALSLALVQGSLAELRIEQGDTVEADRWLSLAEDFLLTQSARFERLKLRMRLLRARIEHLSGNGAAALQALESQIDRLGPADVRTSPFLRLTAGISLERGFFDRALELADDAVRTASVVARDPEQSADVGESYLVMGESLQAMGRHHDARTAFEHAATSLGAGLGRDHPSTIYAIERSAGF